MIVSAIISVVFCKKNRVINLGVWYFHPSNNFGVYLLQLVNTKQFTKEVNICTIFIVVSNILNCFAIVVNKVEICCKISAC